MQRRPKAPSRAGGEALPDRRDSTAGFTEVTATESAGATRPTDSDQPGDAAAAARPAGRAAKSIPTGALHRGFRGLKHPDLARAAVDLYEGSRG